MRQQARPRWSREQAWQWYEQYKWLCGFNYVPSSAVNSTEMWQAPTFDPATIERELGWVASVGFNTCRIFLQYLVWQTDPAGQLARLDQFLGMAQGHGLTTTVCLFDDCAWAGREPYLGQQAAPVPGVHNSGWTPSPGHLRVVDQTYWPELEAYVNSVVGNFGTDRRILLWDLYNEPGHSGMDEKSLPLLEACFEWARAVQPSQPLTAGTHPGAPKLVDQTMLKCSDIITFHNYETVSLLEREIEFLVEFGRPLICTEWMARSRGSLFETHLPVFKGTNTGCYIWGLVRGKTQTHLSWENVVEGEPEKWFHDLFHWDGQPYLKEEVEHLQRFIDAPANRD